MLKVPEEFLSSYGMMSEGQRTASVTGCEADLYP